MEPISIILGVVGEIAKTLIVNFILGRSKKIMKDEIEKQVAIEMAKLKLPIQISPSDLTRRIIEQLILIASDPNSPIKLQEEEFVLRESPALKPLIGSKKQWAKKEIQARLWQLEQVIERRKLEAEISTNNVEAVSKIPPLLKQPTPEAASASLSNDSISKDWKRRIQDLPHRIEERRQHEE